MIKNVEEYKEWKLDILNSIFLNFKKMNMLKIVYTLKNNALIKSVEPREEIIYLSL
tara:strand:+ start:67 stop:234 length:168 start_codon:yes stop_codon:yes gene_type:complete